MVNRYLVLFLLFLLPLHAADLISPAAETILVDGVEVLLEDYNLFGIGVTGLSFDEVYQRLSSYKIYEGRISHPEDLKAIGISSEYHPYSLYAQIMMIYYSSTTDFEKQKLLVYFLSRNMAYVDVSLKSENGGPYYPDVYKVTVDSLFKEYFGMNKYWNAFSLIATGSIGAFLGCSIGDSALKMNFIEPNKVMILTIAGALIAGTIWSLIDYGSSDAKFFEENLAEFEQCLKLLRIVELDKKVPNIVTQKFEVLKKELSKIEYIKDGKLDKSLFKDALMLASEFTDDLAGNAFFEASGAVEVE